jgi:hypothetical protein
MVITGRNCAPSTVEMSALVAWEPAACLFLMFIAILRLILLQLVLLHCHNLDRGPQLQPHIIPPVSKAEDLFDCAYPPRSQSETPDDGDTTRTSTSTHCAPAIEQSLDSSVTILLLGSQPNRQSSACAGNRCAAGR